MSFGPIVSAEWLADNLDDVVVVDVRWSLDEGAKRSAFDAGHIPGAVFADLDTDLADPPSDAGGRHPLPSPVAFAETLSRLGIGDTSRVVAYDDAGGLIAARLWWMLDVYNREVAVLDGGFDAWTGKISKAKPKPADTQFTPRPWPERRRITAAALEHALDSDVVVLDARSAERYADGGPVDPRPGHITGARNAPAGENLSDDGTWLAPRRLKFHYEELEADGENVVAYCGSGVTACADLLGRRLAELPDGRLYVGSFSQWGANPERPAVTGPDPA